MGMALKRDYALELSAEKIVSKYIEKIEDIKVAANCAGEVVRIFSEGKEEINALSKNAKTTEDKMMLLSEIKKLEKVEVEKLAHLKEVKVELPSLFNKPKGAAVATQDEHVDAKAAKSQ